MSKNLVIYYSRRGENYVNGGVQKLAKGNTEYCAEFIRDAVGADLFKVETVEEYSESYMTCIKEAQSELRSGARPALKHYLDDISGYDNIFVCGPCWWGTYPCAMFTQLEKLDFTGKRVFPLMTHEGSGLGSCERDLTRICAGAELGSGLAVHGAEAPSSRKVVADWAKKCAL